MDPACAAGHGGLSPAYAAGVAARPGHDLQRRRGPGAGRSRKLPSSASNSDGRVEALITQPTGIAEISVGNAAEGVIELATDQVALTPTAKNVIATRRRYTLIDEDTLDFIHDLAAVDQPLQHHLTAQLRREHTE